MVPNDENADNATDTDNDSGFMWGWEIQDKLSQPDKNRDNKNKFLSRFKLLLDKSQSTSTVRENLAPTMRALKKEEIIGKNGTESVLEDYLTCLFRFVKKELEGILDGNCTVEFVLCVPPIWTQKATHMMQSAMTLALQQTGFPGVADGSIDDLFIVSEPEAAAAFVLENEHSIKVRDARFKDPDQNQANL